MAIYTRTGDQGTTGLWGGKRISKGNWLMEVIGSVDELNSHLGLATAMLESTRSAVSINQGLGQTNSLTNADVNLAKLIGQLKDVQRELFETGAELANGQNRSNQKDNNHHSQLPDHRSELPRMAERFISDPNFNEPEKVTDGQNGVSPLLSKQSSTDQFGITANRLERLIDEMEKDLPRLENFILPGGGVIGAQLMICRAVCRRTERELVRYLGPRIRKQSTKQEPAAGEAADHLFGRMDMTLTLAYLNRLSDYLFVASRWVNWVLEEKEIIWKR